MKDKSFKNGVVLQCQPKWHQLSRFLTISSSCLRCWSILCCFSRARFSSCLLWFFSISSWKDRGGGLLCSLRKPWMWSASSKIITCQDKPIKWREIFVRMWFSVASLSLLTSPHRAAASLASSLWRFWRFSFERPLAFFSSSSGGLRVQV